MTLTVGSTLQSGKYVIQAMADYGELEVVYHARHTPLNQMVVLKTLNENLRDHADFDTFRQRLIEAATHLARCQHPNLVRVLDCFEDQGIPYVALEHVAGQSLADVVRGGQPLSAAQALLYTRQIGLAVNHIHQQGLIYRGVEPRSIIRNYGTDHIVLTGAGVVTLWPVGVANSESPSDAAHLPAFLGATSGTPTSDISAIARTLFFLLTGDRLLDADSLERSTLRQQHPHLPTSIEEAIRRAITHAAAVPPVDLMEWLASLEHTFTQSIEQPFPCPTPVSSIATRAVSPNSGTQTLISPQGDLPNQGRLIDYQPIKLRPKPWIGIGLVATSVAAAGIGAYLGFSLRFQETSQLSRSPILGREIFGSEQSFAPSNQWPGLDSDEISTSRVLFERSGTRSSYSDSPEPDLVESPLLEEETILAEPDPAIGSDTISDAVDDWKVEFSPLPPLDSTEPAVPAPPIPSETPSTVPPLQSPAPSFPNSGATTPAPPKVMPTTPPSELLPLPEPFSSDLSS
jgi:serine/threonine-protein kinase